MLENALLANLTAVLFYAWLIIGTLFLFIELAMPGFLGFVSCSFGCFAAAFATHYQVSPFWQCWIALGIAGISFLILWGIVESKKSTSLYKTNAYSLIGQDAIVTEEVSKSRAGRVKIKGEEWVAITHGSSILEPTQKVRIKALDGNMLIVG